MIQLSLPFGCAVIESFIRLVPVAPFVMALTEVCIAALILEPAFVHCIIGWSLNRPVTSFGCDTSLRNFWLLTRFNRHD